MAEQATSAQTENVEGMVAFYERESARIRESYEASRDGVTAIAARTHLVDELIQRLWQKYLETDGGSPTGLAAVALGGYGRKQLFPHSDIDLLFLYGNEEPHGELRDRIRAFNQTLWDAKLKVSPQTRSIADCDRLHPDNVEFTISLLDSRFLCGDRDVFYQMHDGVLPQLAAREAGRLIKDLCEVNDKRRLKFGNTIYHLEPNLKDGPGGLRDHNVALWLSLMSGFGRTRRWSDPVLAFPPRLREECNEALRFLFSVRCYLHYRQGRDDNNLIWDAQDECAKLGVGLRGVPSENTEEWMRVYFRNCRVISKLASQALEDAPSTRSSLYRQFQSWRSRVSNADFSVVNGRVYLQQPAAISDPEMMLRAFEFVAQHGTPLAAATEQRISQGLTNLAEPAPDINLWHSLSNILTRPQAAMALRLMHQLGVLGCILPEFKAVDCLVLRDLYHRYTVDEHSIMAIESLQGLRNPQGETEQHFAEVMRELLHPERLLLATLLHDVGKAFNPDDHVTSGTDLARKRLTALKLKEDEIDDVCFLIQKHLEMSATMRRDIFDAESVESFARKVATPERLKMLCLLTYADISAVNPGALTAWKAENLWQLYIGASRSLGRLLDQDRLHPNEDDEQLTSIRMLAPRLGRRLKEFLEGLPQRYLKVHSAEEILAHIEMASHLGAKPVQSKLNRKGETFELVVVTSDRPILFAKIAGTLAAWGMNIVRADVYTNSSGIAVDTFQFTDQFHTLELNLQEWDRFQASIADVLTGAVSLEKLAAGRRGRAKGLPNIEIRTTISFDDESSQHSTLMEVVTQDRTGLLYRIGAQLAESKCNIELALIDTEGRMAIDVFYLTSNGSKLDAALQKRLAKNIAVELESKA